MVDYEKLLVQILIKYLVSKVSGLQSYARFPEQNKKKIFRDNFIFSIEKGWSHVKTFFSLRINFRNKLSVVLSSSSSLGIGQY